MKRTLSSIVGTVVVLLLIAVAVFGYWKYGPNSDGTIIKDSGDGISDYSAVFLTNGQVYFGKMYGTENGQLDVRDIYYLQVNQQIQPDGSTKATPSPSASPDIVLVKLGEELHGPNDRMLINKDQVLFTESLKNGSKVVEAINKNKK